MGLAGKEKVPALPPPGNDVGPQTRRAITAVIEALNARLGRTRDPLEEAVTRRDLLVSGLANIKVNGKELSGGEGSSDIIPGSGVTIRPQVPTGLVVTGGITRIILSINKPTYAGHSHVIFYHSDADDPATAVPAGISFGVSIAVPVEPGHSGYYWAKNVSTSGDESAFNKVAGTLGQASADPADLLDLLNAKLSDETYATGFEIHPNKFAIQGPGGLNYIFIVDGANIYLDTVFIKDASISGAKILDLTVDKLTGDLANFVNVNATAIDVAVLTGNLANFVNANITYLDVAKLTGNLANFVNVNATAINVAVLTGDRAGFVSLNTANGSIGTLKLAGNAVTAIWAASYYGTSQGTWLAWATIHGWSNFNHGHSETIPCLIESGGDLVKGIQQNGSGDAASYVDVLCQARLYVDGAIYSTDYLEGGFTINVVLNLAPGNHDIRLEFYRQNASYQPPAIRNTYLKVHGVKR